MPLPRMTTRRWFLVVVAVAGSMALIIWQRDWIEEMRLRRIDRYGRALDHQAAYRAITGSPAQFEVRLRPDGRRGPKRGQN